MIKRKVWKKKRSTLNVVKCDGAICVSVEDNYKRYYAQGVSSRILNIERYTI